MEVDDEVPSTPRPRAPQVPDSEIPATPGEELPALREDEVVEPPEPSPLLDEPENVSDEADQDTARQDGRR